MRRKKIQERKFGIKRPVKFPFILITLTAIFLVGYYITVAIFAWVGPTETPVSGNIDFRAECEAAFGKVCNTGQSCILDCSTASIGTVCAGGIVAYHDNSGGTLIVAQAPDQSTSVEWGCRGTGISTSASYGTGPTNTAAIMSGCATRPIAASVCDLLSLNGYNDWFLPSRDDLTILYQNRVAISGSFENATYWSSSQSNSNNAFGLNLSTGGSANASKATTYRVRCARFY